MTALEEPAREITRAETVGSWRLWFGAIGGGAAWFGHLVTNYSLEEWFACSSSARATGQVLGWDVQSFATAANLLFLVIAGAATLAAFSCWRELRATGPGELERARWMARAGLIADLMFVAIIVWGFAPSAILGVCEYAP